MAETHPILYIPEPIKTGYSDYHIGKIVEGGIPLVSPEGAITSQDIGSFVIGELARNEGIAAAVIHYYVTDDDTSLDGVQRMNSAIETVRNIWKSNEPRTEGSINAWELMGNLRRDYTHNLGEVASVVGPGLVNRIKHVRGEDFPIVVYTAAKKDSGNPLPGIPKGVYVVNMDAVSNYLLALTKIFTGASSTDFETSEYSTTFSWDRVDVFGYTVSLSSLPEDVRGNIEVEMTARYVEIVAEEAKQDARIRANQDGDRREAIDKFCRGMQRQGVYVFPTDLGGFFPKSLSLAGIRTRN